MHQVFICILLSSIGKLFATCSEIIVGSHKDSGVMTPLGDYSIQIQISFVLVSHFGSDRTSLNLQVLGELQIPYAVIDASANRREIRKRNCTHIKHGKVFMYVNPPVSVKDITFPGKSLPPVASSWMESCRQFLGLRCNWDSIIAKDIFLFTSLGQKSTRKLIPRMSSYLLINKPRGISNTAIISQQNVSGAVAGESVSQSEMSVDEETEISTEVKTLKCTFTLKTLQACSYCDMERCPIENTAVTPLWTVISKLTRGITDEPSMYLLMQNHSYAMNNRSRDMLPLTYKQNGNSLSFVSSGLVLNSLVFISRKLPPSDGMSEALSPMSIASWVGLVLAYALTAIVFGVVKALTINNLDDSLYEYFLHYMLRIMNEDYKSSNKYGYDVNKSRFSIADISKIKDEGDFLETEWAKARRNSRAHRVSVCYSENSSNSNCDNEGSEGSQGQISKAILHVTIRIVSFVLIASYEGKLYSSITFPKPHLLSTFEELVASDQYAIKVTKETVQGGHLRIPSAEFPKDEMMLINNRTGDRNNNNDSLVASSGEFRTLKNTTTKVVGSVTIEDCINWVESSSDSSNNACIGYEFELRNLHKTHRFDKLVAKSNKKLFRNGLQSRRHRGRSSRLFPGAFQISKWIMESGIMQLWNLAETSFTDSIGDASHANQSKTFTIKDYMGLFTVYFVLLFLSCVMFVSELGVWWTNFRHRSETNYTQDICNCLVNFAAYVKQFVENIVEKSKHFCRKVKRKNVKVHKIIQC